MPKVLLVSSCIGKANIYLRAFQKYASGNDQFRLILFNTSENAARQSLSEVKELKRNPLVQNVCVLPATFLYLKKPKPLWFVVFFISMILKVVSLRRQFHPDVIHGYFAGLEVLICFLTSNIFKAYSVVTAIGADVLIELPKYKKPPYKQILDRIWRDFDKVVVVCDDIAKRLINQLGHPEMSERVEIIPDGVDLEEFKPEKKYTSDSFTLLYVASFLPKKGHAYLLKAMRILAEAGHDDIKLIFAGDGPLKENLKQQVLYYGLEDSVEFAGFVKHTEISNLFRNVDAFVLPSLYEGLPVALLEAMASGLPVIATNVGGIPDAVKNMENGILVPARDEKRLADAIVTLKNDPLLRQRMGRIGRAIAKKKYDVRTVLQRIEGLYRNSSDTS